MMPSKFIVGSALLVLVANRGGWTDQRPPQLSHARQESFMCVGN